MRFCQLLTVFIPTTHLETREMVTGRVCRETEATGRWLGPKLRLSVEGPHRGPFSARESGLDQSSQLTILEESGQFFSQVESDILPQVSY